METKRKGDKRNLEKNILYLTFGLQFVIFSLLIFIISVLTTLYWIGEFTTTEKVLLKISILLAIVSLVLITPYMLYSYDKIRELRKKKHGK